MSLPKYKDLENLTTISEIDKEIFLLQFLSLEINILINFKVQLFQPKKNYFYIERLYHDVPIVLKPS